MTAAESYAIAKMEVDIAWADVETALTPEEMSDACRVWWEKRQILREVLIGAGA